MSLLDHLCHQPEESHWVRFVDLFTPILRRWASRLGIPPADIEDMLQQVYITLFRKLPDFKYDPNRSFRAWLWTLFHRQSIDWHRKHHREATFSVSEIESLASAESVEEAGVYEYRQLLLRQALHMIKDEIPEITWQLFWKNTVEGQSGVEVARHFGVTPNAVYLARGRVLARLRLEIADIDR